MVAESMLFARMYLQIDLGDVKVEFQKKYGKSLASWIKDDCGGDFRRMLLAIVKDWSTAQSVYVCLPSL